MKEICPKCGNENTTLVKYDGTNCVVCKKCGYDERNDINSIAEFDSSQKAKGSYSVYKNGGPDRTRKK